MGGVLAGLLSLGWGALGRLQSGTGRHIRGECAGGWRPEAGQSRREGIVGGSKGMTKRRVEKRGNRAKAKAMDCALFSGGFAGRKKQCRTGFRDGLASFLAVGSFPVVLVCGTA